MMPRFNAVGRLGSDPKIYNTKDGKVVAKIDVAFSEYDETLWLQCVGFGKTAELLRDYFKKGDGIEIFAKLQMSRWTDKDGQERERIEGIIERVGFLPGSGCNKKKRERKPRERKRKRDTQESVPEVDIDENEIPF